MRQRIPALLAMALAIGHTSEVSRDHAPRPSPNEPRKVGKQRTKNRKRNKAARKARRKGQRS